MTTEAQRLTAWQFQTIRQTVELMGSDGSEMLAAQFFIEKSPPDVTVRGAGLDVGAWFCSDAKTEEVLVFDRNHLNLNACGRNASRLQQKPTIGGTQLEFSLEDE
eukprot:595027-Hanusia_phi.AAC.5